MLPGLRLFVTFWIYSVLCSPIDCLSEKYEGCGLDCLQASVLLSSSKIEEVFGRYLEDLTILSKAVVSMDLRGNLQGRSNFDFSKMVTDGTGLEYWGDVSPDREVEFFVPGWAEDKVFDYRRMDTVPLIMDLDLTLRNSSRNLTEFCRMFFTNSTYLPYFCRNISHFDNDSLRIPEKYFYSIVDSLIANRQIRNETVAYYLSDIFGVIAYYPKLDPDMGALLGGQFVWPSFLYVAPKFNPTRKAIYSNPYSDQAGQGYIITAMAPIYLGDFFYGATCIDLNMLVNIRLIEEKPTANTLTVLTSDTGLVILATELAFNRLFGLSPSKNVADQSVISYIQHSNILNFSYIFNLTARAKSGSYNVTISYQNKTEKFVLQYSLLDSLTNWRLLVFAPHQEVFPEKSIITQSKDVGTAIVAVSTISMICPIMFFVTIILRWDFPSISSISPPFTLISVFGSILLNMSPLFLASGINSCITWLWCLAIGFVMFFGGFLIKTYRIERIFTLGAKKFKKARGLKNHHLLPGLIILIGMELVLLIVWTVVSPISSITFADPTRPNTLVTNCGATNEKTFWGFFGAQIIFFVCFFC
eukprot:TRINITY_DN760_c0_g3_i3.p1 TRINITY_DN760_c0_g3~~TRINITY_DN760_c0_g3_i3.p1  ORF type:complete len:586 (+),score=19.58 TRINITY_DN760_c0_g3_i3:26-1783(+)